MMSRQHHQYTTIYHTVEELYAAVEKKPKSNADENKDKAPLHTVKKMHTEREIHTNSSKYN